MSHEIKQKKPSEDPRYHDTYKLLKRYRDAVWSLEVSVMQVKNKFRIEYECSIEDFLESIYVAGADLSGTDIENYAKSIERSHKMLTLLENSINLLRAKHKKGEEFYWVLYYTYICPQKLRSVDEIIDNLRPHIRDISPTTFYRIREAAIDALSSILWGFSSQDTLGVLEQFFPEEQ